jgi:tripartite-type tricarboxylate transporter receptor subunit TctC
MFDAAPTALQHAKSGSLRILGVVAPSRSSLLPDVPTLAEQGLRDIDLVGWLGIYGPAKLPPEVVTRLNAALVKALATPEVRKGFAAGAYEAVSSTPDVLRALTREAYDRWGSLVKDIGLVPQ